MSEAPATEKPDKKQQAAAPKGLRIKRLVFDKPHDIGGGDAVAHTVHDNFGAEDNRKRWRITFLPDLRHHRVEFFGIGEKAPSRVFLVHESRCSPELMDP